MLPDEQHTYTLVLRTNTGRVDLKEVDVLAPETTNRTVIWNAFVQSEHSVLYDLTALDIVAIHDKTTGERLWVREDFE